MGPVSHLILVRHSEPEPSAELASALWPLSESGRRRCQALAREVAGHGADLLVASPQPKARQTALILGEVLGLPVELLPDLREHERAGVGWLPADEFRAGMRRFFAQPGERVFGEESADQACRRFRSAVAELLPALAERRVCAVSHGAVMSLLVGRLCGIDPEALWQRLGMPAYLLLGYPGLKLLWERDHVEEAAALGPQA